MPYAKDGAVHLTNQENIKFAEEIFKIAESKFGSAFFGEKYCKSCMADLLESVYLVFLKSILDDEDVDHLELLDIATHLTSFSDVLDETARELVAAAIISKIFPGVKIFKFK